ncbi:MAG: hypothetical protein WKI04_15940 [Ferruginibacter sp.]
MKKTIIIAITCGVVAALLLKRKRSRNLMPAPVPQYVGNAGKHLTTVFARAKKQGL